MLDSHNVLLPLTIVLFQSLYQFSLLDDVLFFRIGLSGEGVGEAKDFVLQALLDNEEFLNFFLQVGVFYR